MSGEDIHKNGYCAIFGSGGSTTYFGPVLPRPNNVPAMKLNSLQYDKLIGICGDSWRSVDYACCDDDQMEALKSNLAKVDPLIASCPACKENFYQLFCHFSCSPNQSTFINVTETQLDLNGDDVVKELDYYIDSTAFAEPFFDSCKSIKFGATNGYAMDLIGGGAQNYSQFLKFLGDKKPELGGSPFQINFKNHMDDNNNNGIQLFQIDPKSCNDIDPNFRCACSDCPDICPTLEIIPLQGTCSVGPIPCTSFYFLLCYLVIFLGYMIFGYFKRYKNQNNGIAGDIFLVDDTDEFINNEDINEEVDYQNLNSFNAEGTYSVNNKLETCFFHLGKYCAQNVRFVILLGLTVAFSLSLCMFFLKLETNPVNLWVSSHSDAFTQKQKFDESFGPFYRTQQIIVSNKTGPVLQSYDFIKWWFEKESEILNLSIDIEYENEMHKITYEDICFKPTEETCILESFTQYFDGNIDNLPEESWKQKIASCASSPVECLPSFQQPLKKSLIFGGDIDESVFESGAIVVTLLNNNDNDPNSTQIAFASEWEFELESYLLNNLTIEANERGLDISFMTEISLEKELNKSTNTDATIIIISYLVMFTYASLALGESTTFQNRKIQLSTVWGPINRLKFIFKLFTHTRFGLGLIGIIMVLLSVTSAVGFWSLLGLKSTLIIAEVIPFLILAVGVDNIFLICNAVAHIETSRDITQLSTIPDTIGYALSSVGSSIALSCSCQFLCFMLGSIVPMPAVRNFALYSAVAIVFNTALQLTVFLSVLSLDMTRLEKSRLDLLPFIEVCADPITETSTGYNAVNQILNKSESEDGKIATFFQKYYSKWLFSSVVSKSVLWGTIILTGISLSLLPNIELGLDQRIALPLDSYLINYFNDFYEYLNVGPPVYFVVEDLDVTKLKNQKALCSKFTSCDSFSLVNILLQEAERSDISMISEPPASWIDDFLMWLNPSLSECCTIRRHPSQSGKEFCPPFSSPRLCQTCYENRTWQYDMSGFPTGDEFLEFTLAWLDQDSYPCPLAGKSPYGHSIDFSNERVDGGDKIKGIKRSAFRTSHTPLKSQSDFISAYENSLRVIQEVKEYHPNLNLWAYSPFYIFFVQYRTLIPLTIILIGCGLLLTFGISTILLGSWRNSLVLIAYLITVLISIGSWMSIQGIGLNAVSLVNLLICLGLGVEFGIHLVREFNFTHTLSSVQLTDDDNESKRSIPLQAQHALVSVGPATLSGITLTKVLGISVLSFTHSQIFRVYYFKMWVGLIGSASLGSLILLPVLLGKFGDKGWKSHKV